MIIGYSKKVIKKDLILGSLFFILGIFFVMEEPDNILRYGFLLLSVLHLISGIYQFKMPYLRLENGLITRGGLISKTISLSEVERIKKFAGDYTIFTSEKKLKINSQLVSKTQTAELDRFLRTLDIPFEETHSKKYNYS